ncbi:MAG: patatin-like phospholipase family protein [Planctomycetes bacterium]|nr:patatin-like phospholipase family protein [Planctomycetota bacterium]
MRFVTLILALAAAAPLRAQDSAPSDAESPAVSRPRIGLVLSGGGARGAAHIGVLRVLEELHVPVDAIAGTSMGSIIGGLYAAGLTPDEIEQAIAGVAWGEAFKDRPPRSNSSYRRKQDDRDYLVSLQLGLRRDGFSYSRGLLQGQNLGLLLKQFAATAELIEDFDELPIPYRAVATDAVTGEAVVLSSGDLALAMRASMSVPGVFDPIEVDGRLLIDGGLSAQTPIGIARRMGVDLLIVVDLTEEEDVPAESINTPFTLLAHLMLTTVTRNAQAELGQLSANDILIEPRLDGYSSAAFDAAIDMIPPGEEAAHALAWRLRELSIPAEEYGARRAAIRRSLSDHVFVDRVIVLNDSRLGDDVVRERLGVEAGQDLKLERLHEGIDRIYGLGYFETVTYDLERRGGETVLVVRAKRKSWGPNYARFGVQLDSDFQGRSVFTLGTRLLFTEMNARGGELITDFQVGNRSMARAAFYQPIDRGLRWFVEPRAEVSRRTLDFYDFYDQSNNRIAEYQQDEYVGALDAGYVIGNWAELRAGYEYGRGNVLRRTGDPRFPSGSYRIGEAFASFETDTLDAWAFPNSGTFAGVKLRLVREALGSEQDADVVELNGSTTRSFENYTTTLWGRLATTDESPLDQTFHGVGGLFNLSGLAENQLIGSTAGMLGAGLRKRFGDLEATLQRKTYVGGTLETGGAWFDGDPITTESLVFSGSLYVAMDTVVGPFYLAWGHAEGGRDRLYLALGKTFHRL